jgi:hypothetical protein
MIKAITIGVLVLAAASSYGLYEIKYEVQHLEEYYNDLSQDLLEDQEAIHILKAEWSYLSRPERLQELSERFLALGPTDVAQIGNVDQIPARRLGIEVGPATVALKKSRKTEQPQSAGLAIDVVAKLGAVR